MAHYAKVLNGKVIEVIVAEADFFKSFIDNSPGQWLQTSYNTLGGVHAAGGTPLRKNFAGIGYNYDADADMFYAPQPFESWILNPDSAIWEAPVPMPTDGKRYVWDELIKNWTIKV